jgi:Ca-activated chloride channel family protein
MNLLLPLGLLGLLTLPIILILHLLRNRRELLPISSLYLWRDLQQKRQGALPRSIPLTFMLLLQLLVATALSLALARPALSFLIDVPQRTVFILDMTTSMTAEDAPQAVVEQSGPRRFDAARQIIETHLQTMGDEDSLAVISLDPQPQILFTGDAEQKTQALLTLDNLVPGATGLDLSAALTLANGLIDDTANQEQQIIILTDGNYTVEPDTIPPMLAPVSWEFIPSQGSEIGSNAAVLNASVRTMADGRPRLFARIVNYGDTPIVRSLQVSTDQGSFDEMTIQLEPQAESANIWTLPARAETATVEIIEPDILPLDNRADLIIKDAARYRALLVSDTPDLLARALEVQPGLDLAIDSLAMTQYDPADFDLVIFDEIPSILTAWPPGNLLIVNPPLGHPLLPAQNFARNLRPDLETASPLLTGVNLSGVYFSRAPQLSLPDWAEADLYARDLLSPDQGPDNTIDQLHPLIFHGSVGNSRVVVWAFDLAESNLPARLALPLLTANTLSTLISPSPPPVVSIGQPVLLAGSFNVETPDGRRLFTTSETEMNENIIFSYTKQPGLYKIYNEKDTLVAGFAVHAGSALESNLTPQLQPGKLNVMQISEQTIAKPEVAHTEYWPWLAGIALSIVLVEGWMAWRG